MRRASAGSEASALCSFVALIFLLSSAADQRAVHCQSQFRPMNQHQNLPPSQGLFVGQSPRLGPQLQQIRQRQVRSQQALLPRPSAGLPPWPQQQQQQQQQPRQQQIAGRSVSDRRASSDAVQFAQNSLAQQVPTRAPALAGSSTIKQGNLQDQPQFHFHEQNGKLLICYYTTKQTAPYWPKDSREFVIPASRLEQAASEFLRANSDAGQKFLAPQANIGAADSPAMFGLDQAKQVNQQQRRSVFAGGRRLVVVAPEFVPFNQSLMMAGGAIGNLKMARPTSELGRDQRPDSLAQMFFMANNRRKTIADRQDNGATITSGSITTNQSYVAPQLAQFVSANNEQASRGSNVIVFERNKSKNDLSNRHVGGPDEAGQQQQQQRPANSNTQLSPQMQQSTGASAATAVSAPVPRLPGRNGNAREMSAHFADNEQLPAGGNSRDHLEGAAEARQELQLSPGLGRAFIVGTTIATAPSSSSSSAPNYAVEDKQEQPSNSLYYYYNVPTGSTSQQPTLSAIPSAPTTVTFGASNSFRPAGLVQQQHHELSGATLAGFNSNGIPQRAPSSALPMPIENELGMQQVSQSPSSPGGLVPMSATSPQAAPTSYLISGATQSQRPNGLIVSDALSALTTAPSTQQQQARYTNSPSLLKSNYLFKSATSLAAGAADASSAMAASPTTPVVVQTIMQSATARPTAGPSAALQSKLDEPATSRPQHQQQAPQHHNGKLTVGLGGGSLSAALVSSPLSTMFDVFGAASQYLMRFKPSSLISPASLAAFNSIGSALDHANLHAKLKPNSSSLVSLPAGQQQQQQQRHASGAANGSASSLAGGFLTRLSLQHNQRREDICGRTIQTPERRIIGGEGAKYGEFPYQVHIKIAKHQCGGALIDKQSIVTAAHCVYHFITRAPVSKLQIVIGAYDIEDEQYQELPPQYFKVNKVKLHPNFRFSASHPDRYDIAILKLDKPVKYTDNVLPVCLPGKDLKYENMVGTVTGFGKTDPSLSNRYGTRLLQKVDVPIIENSECERWHRTRGIDLKIFPEMMCAGYEDGLKDACVGDSGGPLVVKTPAGNDGQSFRWTLAGITSAGFGCAQSRQPGIYHRVSHTVDWILENID